MSEKPLFIPLTAEWFDAFERGEKDTEYRPLGSRWNAKTCRIGRAVTLSRGYGKHRRLSGVVAGFQEVGPDAHPAIRCVYPTGDRFAAIRITLASKDAAEKAKGRPESLPNGARFSCSMPMPEADVRNVGDGYAGASIAHAETGDNAGSAGE